MFIVAGETPCPQSLVKPLGKCTKKNKVSKPHETHTFSDSGTATWGGQNVL